MQALDSMHVVVSLLTVAIPLATTTAHFPAIAEWFIILLPQLNVNHLLFFSKPLSLKCHESILPELRYHTTCYQYLAECAFEPYLLNSPFSRPIYLY